MLPSRSSNLDWKYLHNITYPQEYNCTCVFRIMWQWLPCIYFEDKFVLYKISCYIYIALSYYKHSNICISLLIIWKWYVILIFLLSLWWSVIKILFTYFLFIMNYGVPYFGCCAGSSNHISPMLWISFQTVSLFVLGAG